MKAALVAILCLAVTVLGAPQPDQDLKLDDAHTHTTSDAAPEEAPRKGTPQGTEPDRTRLLGDLLNKYNKGVNPDNVTVNFGVTLLDFRVHEERNALESYVWLRYGWKDARLKWTPSEYGGIEMLRIDSTSLWKPDITLYNSADPVNMINCWDTNTVVTPEGEILFVPPCKMTSTCSFTLKKEPYGDQKCSMKFGSWTFDGNVVNIQLKNGTSTLELSQLQNSSGFDIVSSTAERNDKYYPCCPDPYPDVTFNITIKRIPGEELFSRLKN